MSKFVGAKDGRICMVSDQIFKNNDLMIVEVPKELEELTNSQLILECKIINHQLIHLKNKKSCSELKIALVSNHASRCGIATYGDQLFPEIVKQVKDFKLFMEENNHPTYDILKFGSGNLTQDQVKMCWKRGEPLTKLIGEIRQYQPDIVLVNHEFGIFPNARYWLSFLTQLSEFRIIVIMHSVYHHLDKMIAEAPIPEVVVHLESARDVLLLEKEISGKVYVVPHGCQEFRPGKLWNYYQSKHTLIQVGFLYQYKNFEQVIQAVGKLKDKYPDIFFTAIGSESDHSQVEHFLYYQKLIDLIKELELENHVSILRGFQSDQVLDSYLRTNQIAVYPYRSNPDHKVHGASGSVRLAMSTGIPVISSSIPHFSDVPSLKADTLDQLVETIDLLFSDDKLRQQQLSIQEKFLVENSWKSSAEKYLKIFES